MKITSWLPYFNGFYDTVEGDRISLDEGDFEYLQEQVDEKLESGAGEIRIDYDNTYEFYDNENEAREDFCKEFLETFKAEYWDKLEKLGISEVKFHSLSSPREYNFANDSTNADFEFDEKKFKKEYEIIRKSEKFEEFLREEYTSYDGFHSFHSNDSDDESWSKNEVIKDEHKFAKIVEFYLDDENSDLLSQEVEFSTMDYFDFDGFWQKINPLIEQRNSILNKCKEAKRNRSKKILLSL